MADGSGNAVYLHDFHMLVIVVQEENLQEPNQNYNSKSQSGEVNPKPEFYAFCIETNFRTQIYNLPL